MGIRVLEKGDEGSGVKNMRRERGRGREVCLVSFSPCLYFSGNEYVTK